MKGYTDHVAESSTQENKHHTRKVGELRIIMPADPGELTLQALSPKQRDYSLYRQTVVGNTSC